MTTQTATAGLQEQGGFDTKKLGVWIASVGIWFLPLLWIDPTTYAVLTVAGLAMGMLIFLTASGLTLIFGLMDVLNLAHGAFFVWGAYVGFSILNGLQQVGWVEGANAAQSIGSVLLCLLAACGGGRANGHRVGKDAGTPYLRQPPQADTDHHGGFADIGGDSQGGLEPQ